MKRTLTCIVCPFGCTLTAETDGENGIRVEGNACPRGKAYAETECTAPMRTVTTTVRCTDGGLVAVKTNRAIPKENMFDCIRALAGVTAALPVSVGDVIVRDLYGSDIVATEERK